MLGGPKDKNTQERVHTPQRLLSRGSQNRQNAKPIGVDTDNNTGLDERLKLDRNTITSMNRNAPSLAMGQADSGQRPPRTERAGYTNMMQSTSQGRINMGTPEKSLDLHENPLEPAKDESTSGEEESVDDCVSMCSRHCAELVEQAYRFRLEKLAPGDGLDGLAILPSSDEDALERRVFDSQMDFTLRRLNTI